MQTCRNWGRGDRRWGRGDGLEGTKTVRQEREEGCEAGQLECDSHFWLTWLLLQNLQVKWENEWRINTMCCSEPYICIFPTWLFLPFIPVMHCLVLFFMGHNARVSGRQTDPEPLLHNRESSSVSLWASYLWDFTACWIFNKSSYNSLWKQPVIFIPFFNNKVPPVVRENKGGSNKWRNTKVQNSHTPLIVLAWPSPPLKLVKLYRAFFFFLSFTVHQFIFTF